MMLKISILFFLQIFASLVCAQQRIVHYKASKEDFPNPERGFYVPYQTKASNFIPLDAASINQFNEKEHQLQGATYKAYVTLVYRAYELDEFKNSALSKSFLSKVQADFDIARNAGVKLILRFAYTNEAKSGDCKDEYKICPPYGDAPPKIVFKHVEQLKPLLHKNGDVIALLQQGFIGIWGENYFTDYFGDASQNGMGVIADSSWLLRNKLIDRLLQALPKTRNIQVRTPQIKQKYLLGPTANVDDFARKQKNNLRIGFHNDCFMASPDDYGTYFDYGSSTQKRDTANFRMRNYIVRDSRNVPMGGETCDDAYSPQNDCAPHGHILQELSDMHFSYLNMAYNNYVNNDWDSLGCMAEIKKRLGYRIELVKSELPAKALVGQNISIKLNLMNSGFAAPFNARKMYFVLRNIDSKKIISIPLQANIKTWLPGTVVITQKIKIPKNLAKGSYECFFWLPDAYPSLMQNPAYSIRLANENVWESATGYNSLKHTINIQ